MKNKKLARILSVLAAVALLASCVPVALAATTNPSWDSVMPEWVYHGSDARKAITALIQGVDKGDKGSEVTLVSSSSGAAHSTIPANNCYGASSYSFDLTITETKNAPTTLYMALRYSTSWWMSTNGEHGGAMVDGYPRTVAQLGKGLGFKIDLENNKLNVYCLRVHNGTNTAIAEGYDSLNFWDDEAEAEAARYYATTEFDFDPDASHRFVIYKESEVDGKMNFVVTMDGIVIHKFDILRNGSCATEDDFHNVRNGDPFHVLMALNQYSIDKTPDEAIQAKVLFNANPKKTATELSELITACNTKKGSVVDSETPAVGQVKTAAKTEFAAAIATATTVSTGTDQKEETLYPAMVALQAALAKFEKAVVKPVDTAALTEAIEYAEEALEMLGETAIGYDDLVALVAEARTLLTNAATTPSDEGDAMVTALLEAADALELPMDEDDDFGGNNNDDSLGGEDTDTVPGADDSDPDVSDPVETGDSALAVVLSLVLCAAAAAALLLTKKRALAK